MLLYVLLSMAHRVTLLWQEAGQAAAVTVEAAAAGAMDPASRAFWCALGNLYAAARTEVMRLGHAAALRPDASESPMLQNVRTPSWASNQRALRMKTLRVLAAAVVASWPFLFLRLSWGDAWALSEDYICLSPPECLHCCSQSPALLQGASPLGGPGRSADLSPVKERRRRHRSK